MMIFKDRTKMVTDLMQCTSEFVRKRGTCIIQEVNRAQGLHHSTANKEEKRKGECAGLESTLFDPKQNILYLS